MQQRVVRYIGGPLDGREIDVTIWSETALRGGVYHLVNGRMERVMYDPDAGGDPLVWHYRGVIDL